MKKIRAVVAEDSLTVRKLLVDILSAAEDFEVVGEAENGKQAIELCQALRPDVVTLDMMMPVMTGLAATEYIMAYCPTPILIVSASTNRGELFRTYEALAAGAVDILEKPDGVAPEKDWENKLLSSLRRISRIKVITHLKGKLAHGKVLPFSEDAPPVSVPAFGGMRAIAMGASTGGPGAVMEILSSLPADFPLPILLVLHLGKVFGSAFADWLDGASTLPVSFARDGESLPPPGTGQVILAPPDQHMVLKHGRLWLTGDPERHSCRPSVDVLFESAARDLGSAVAGCLLTGMGRDGAEGLLAIHRAGGTTMAQDEASCVVFGMPREAILLGAAQRVLPLSAMAGAFIALARKKPA